jgi:hypothetical protein
MWRCAASLERLSPEVKESVGSVLIKDRTPIPSATTLWCIGRFGARVPLYGLANTAVRKEAAERWISALLERHYPPGRETAEAVFALSQLARVANDRARDVDEDLRSRVLTRLAELNADETVLRPVREYHELQMAQEGQALGDALPIGLRLLSDAASGPDDQ